MESSLIGIQMPYGLRVRVPCPPLNTTKELMPKKIDTEFLNEAIKIDREMFDAYHKHTIYVEKMIFGQNAFDGWLDADTDMKALIKKARKNFKAAVDAGVDKEFLRHSAYHRHIIQAERQLEMKR